MPTVNISPDAILHFVDNFGNALNGGQLFTYIAGTTTKLATYTDSTGATANTNPIILNVRGEASVWLASTSVYKFVLAPATDTDPPTNPIWTQDNIPASPTFPGTVAGSLTVADDISAGGVLTATSGVVSGAGLSVAGSADISGAASVGGTMEVAGVLTAESGIICTAAGFEGQDGFFSGTFGVTGAVTLGSTLGVTGAATIGSTLGVTGTATLAAFSASGTATLEAAVALACTTATPISSQVNGYFMNATSGSLQGYSGASVVLQLGSGTSGAAINFYNGSDTVVGSVSNNLSAVAYNTTSDYRLKTVHGPASTGELIDSVPVYDAHYTASPEHRLPMFFAHELQASLPSVVTGAKDATNAEGKAVYQQVDHSRLVPVLWAEVQALRKRVAALELPK